MASVSWIVIFGLIFAINSATSNLIDSRKCYCGSIENVCPTNWTSLRYLNGSFSSSSCAANEVKYCDIPNGSVSETCGQIKLTVMKNKISGQAKMGEYPWQVAILKRKKGGYTYIGSGVLIHKKHVLSVAHKVDSFSLSDLTIRLGEWDLSSNEEVCDQQDYQPNKIIKHPNYDSNIIESNIALIILDRTVPIAASAHINTACLPSKVRTYGRCWVAGWGGTQELTSGDPKVLRDVSVPIVNHYSCQQSIQTILGENYRLPESVLCAGKGKIDPRMIGMGAPLMCESTSGRWEVVGLLSAPTGSQRRVPSLYTDVSEFTSWIHGQISKNF